MFCDWLRAARRELGMTQRQLGEALGMSASCLGMYEQGRRRPGAAAQARLRCFFRERGLRMPAPPSGPEVPAEKRFRAEVAKARAGGLSRKL